MIFSKSQQSGFTLLEVMVAMGILVIGMSGIMALFSAALSLQKKATERLDVGMSLLAVQAEVERDLTDRVSGKGKQDVLKLSGTDFPVPGNPRYRYRVTLQAMANDDLGRGFWARIEVLAKSRGEDSSHDLGYIPVIATVTNDALIRGAGQER